MEVGWTCWENEGQQMDNKMYKMTFPNTKAISLPLTAHREKWKELGEGYNQQWIDVA